MIYQPIESAQYKAARCVLAEAELIEAELTQEARLLRDEAHELIRTYDRKNYRAPPCTLSVKSSSKLFGPRIVWVRYTSSKRQLTDGSKVRFTEEITGRRNSKYPKTIFRGYSEPLRKRSLPPTFRAAF